MAHDKPGNFYVVFTNVSAEPQAVWEYWNSWGYQAISFELTTTDGKKFLISRRQGEFTRNFPSTFLIEPGEHQVYAIRLNDEWETHPSLPLKAAEMPIILKAFYKALPHAGGRTVQGLDRSPRIPHLQAQTPTVVNQQQFSIHTFPTAARTS